MSERQTLFGVELDPLTMDQTVERCLEAVRDGRQLEIGVVNAAKLVNMRRDPRLADAVSGCDLVVADGQAVVWASRVLRAPLPERVAGIDLFMRLLAEAETAGMSVYFLGAKEEVLEEMVRRVADRFPGLKVAGSRNGYFDDSQQEAIAGAIAAQRRPDAVPRHDLAEEGDLHRRLRRTHRRPCRARRRRLLRHPRRDHQAGPRASGSGRESSGSTAHCRSRAASAGATSPPMPPSSS